MWKEEKHAGLSNMEMTDGEIAEIEEGLPGRGDRTYQCEAGQTSRETHKDDRWCYILLVKIKQNVHFTLLH